MLALSRLGASTWGATFAKARQIYSSIVRPAITYGASVWHQRGNGGRLRGKEHRLEVLQNRALRNVTGAFKKVSTQTMEAEAYTPPIHTTLNKLQDKATLRQRETGRTREIRQACTVIKDRLNLPHRRHRKATPGETKERLLDETITVGTKLSRPTGPRPRGEQTIPPPPPRTAIAVFHRDEWERRWESYRNKRERVSQTEAQRTRLTRGTVAMRKGLQKAESTLATHIRTERIGLRAYLYQRQVPGVDTPACQCGSPFQTAKHILKDCREWTPARGRMTDATGTTDYRRIVSTPRGLKAAARMMIETGLLGQFELARVLLYGEV